MVAAMRRLLLVTLLLVAACTEAEPASAPTTSAPTSSLPPHTFEELEPLFAPIFEPMGLTLTRAGLHDLDRDYARSPDGDHLALYVEPLEDWTPEAYADAILPTMRLLAPEVFGRWPGLGSFDLCLEPPPRVDPDPEPQPATQVFVSRAERNAIDWDTATLADLMAASSDHLWVKASDVVTTSAPWRQAEQRHQSGATGTRSAAT